MIIAKRRIFIAIQVPEELRNTAEVYIKPFFNDRNMRIPKKEGWHITLLFCGYLDEKEIEELKKIVKNVASGFRTFEFFPSKILFAPLNRPRMIWLNFGFSPQFASLKKQIEKAIISCQGRGLFRDFRLEAHEPNPHLTLARFEENYFSNIKKFLPFEGIDLTKETVPFLVKSVDIMESRLSRNGAEYEILTNFTIGV